MNKRPASFLFTTSLALAIAAFIAISLAVIDNPWIASDSDKETCRDLGLAFLAAAGACALPFVQLLGAQLLDSGSAAAKAAERLELMAAEIRLNTTKSLEYQALADFREHYRVNIVQQLKSYAADVVKMSETELFRRFDELLDTKKHLTQQINQLSGRVPETREEMPALVKMEACCRRLLLVTRFPGAVRDERMPDYEQAVNEAKEELEQVDKMVKEWLEARLGEPVVPRE